MRLSRFHVALPLVVGQALVLPAATADHAVRVLRARVGDALLLFNGDGLDYRARISASSKSATTVSIESVQAGTPDSPLQITLVQALARGERMDTILQKSTELGVARIVPVSSERSEVRLDEDRAGKRLAHWSQIIASAAEQCGRSSLPELLPPQSLAQFAAGLVAVTDAEQRYCLHPDSATGLAAIKAPQRLLIAVGPEGGFADRDLAVLDQVGFARLALGPRILRTETAGPAAIAALQARCGDLVGD
jgi:16S rRNA (uracil1498-N3)-methyltransferase